MLFAFKAMGGIKSKYGVFYVYGNHDRPFSMVSSEYTENDLKTAIEYFDDILKSNEPSRYILECLKILGTLKNKKNIKKEK